MICFTIIIVVLNFSNYGFLLYFETKRRSIFCFGPGKYSQTGQVFFCPIMAKGGVC